ncbi:MAG: response regulator transcription factor [Acetobacteraceae bacterium]|nr:MAG: response regulator transcription factor [Acetobacteraceae bacterium]
MEQGRGYQYMQPMMTEGKRENVLVVDPHILRRACLIRFLADWAEGCNAVLHPQSPESLDLAEAGELPFAMAIVNLAGLPVAETVASGWWRDLTHRLSTAPVVLLSDSERTEEVVAAVRAGTRGFIPTTTDPAIALRALTFIMAGGSFFPPGALLKQEDALAGRPAQSPRRGRVNGAPSEPRALTMRQATVYQCLQDGQSNKAIARVLLLRESTVKVHVGQIMRKLGVANRTQIALAQIEAPPRAANSEAPPLLLAPAA